MKELMQKQLTNLLSNKASDLLTKAAKNEKTWKKAMRDPLGFLSENGEGLPNGTELTLYEADWDPKNPSFHVSELDAPKEGSSGFLRKPTLRNHTSPGISCPYGQIPFKTLRTVTVCYAKGFIKGPPVWVPNGSDPRYGHWEFSVQEFCLLSGEEEIWVWECFPLIPLQLEKITRR